MNKRFILKGNKNKSKGVVVAPSQGFFPKYISGNWKIDMILRKTL